MNDNKASEIRRTVVREKEPGILRRWVIELLDDRAELRKEMERLRSKAPGPARPISFGVVTDPRGREDSGE